MLCLNLKHTFSHDPHPCLIYLNYTNLFNPVRFYLEYQVGRVPLPGHVDGGSTKPSSLPLHPHWAEQVSDMCTLHAIVEQLCPIGHSFWRTFLSFFLITECFPLKVACNLKENFREEKTTKETASRLKRSMSRCFAPNSFSLHLLTKTIILSQIQSIILSLGSNYFSDFIHNQNVKIP